MCFVQRVSHVQESVLCILQGAAEQTVCFTVSAVRKIRENGERKFYGIPLQKGAEGFKLVRGVQQNRRFPVRQFLRQFMDQHQQVFQSTSRGDHGEAGVGHTHDFFPALVYGSAKAAELAADIRRIRFLLCLAQPIGNE